MNIPAPVDSSLQHLQCASQPQAEEAAANVTPACLIIFRGRSVVVTVTDSRLGTNVIYMHKVLDPDVLLLIESLICAYPDALNCPPISLQGAQRDIPEK